MLLVLAVKQVAVVVMVAGDVRCTAGRGHYWLHNAGLVGLGRVKHRSESSPTSQ